MEMNNMEKNLLDTLGKEKVTGKEIIEAIDPLARSLVFKKEALVQEILRAPEGARNAFDAAARSCVLALGTADSSRIDGRNEMSAMVAGWLAAQIGCDPLPDAGKAFLRMHRTAQQAAESFFFKWLDSTEPLETPLGARIGELRGEYGSWWWNMPLI